ncbi:hypothetical protein [Prosthecobacter fluviatilis]|uniref:DUF3379 domain-containing protein n=1 Tax=Prosthecobacter fluviatilis TaxID=445931 RepID=A0ABW0KZT1_9BACT
MKPSTDDDLLAIFARLRRSDREDAPAWCPELLDAPRQRPEPSRRWMPAVLAASSVVVLSLFLGRMPQHGPSLSEALPPLFDVPSGELFASIEPSLMALEAPSDFLLPEHLNLIHP